MARIYTHMKPDIDAVSSVFAVKLFCSPQFKHANLVFVPANWNGEEMEHCDIAVDIDAGGKGFKGKKEQSGLVHSCFSLLVDRFAPEEDKKALEPLIEYIDAQDTYGNALKRLAPNLSAGSHAALSITGLNSILYALHRVYPRDDEIIIERMMEILTGLYETVKSKLRAETEALRATFVGDKVAIVRENRETATNGLLFKRGIKIIVFVDGYNIGLVRSNDFTTVRMDDDAFKKIVTAENELPEWFAHSGGFLFARGTRKSPATTPSRVSPLELARAAALLLG